jgi:phenylacetate-CoA ligase
MTSTMRGWVAIGGRREAGPERAALRSFQRAARCSQGYRDHLEHHGIDHRAVRNLAEVPYTDKRSVFSDDIEPWLTGGRVADAAELITSSGSSGLFSLGVTSHAERRGQERAIDATLRALGASDSSPTLLLNCLPMGITVPTRLATVATPSVHVEMATELLARAGRRFDRVVIASEPLFLKELGETALRVHGPEFSDRVVACFVGGEWVAESWRRYVAGLFGFAPDERSRAGVLVSMGAAEAGLHVLTETPALRAVRAACDSQSGRERLLGEDRGYTPLLLEWDARRIHLEEREHTDGARTLVATALERRLMPLVRYDLDDEGCILHPGEVNAAMADLGCGVRIDSPVAAVWGRRTTRVQGEGWSLRPEAVKEGIFSTAAHAGSLTGRFRIGVAGGAPHVHVQMRDGGRPAPRLERHLSELIGATTGVPVQVQIHAYRDYPFHDAGDFQHKPVYV